MAAGVRKILGHIMYPDTHGSASEVEGKGTRTSSTIAGGRGCNIFVPVLGGNGTKIALTGDIFDHPLVKYDEYGASLATM